MLEASELDIIPKTSSKQKSLKNYCYGLFIRNKVCLGRFFFLLLWTVSNASICCTCLFKTVLIS